MVPEAVAVEVPDGLTLSDVDDTCTSRKGDHSAHLDISDTTVVRTPVRQCEKYGFM